MKTLSNLHWQKSVENYPSKTFQDQLYNLLRVIQPAVMVTITNNKIMNPFCVGKLIVFNEIELSVIFLDLNLILSQLCGYETTSPEYLKIHEKTHNNNSFKCDCGRVFKEEYQLVRHKKQDHSNQKVFHGPYHMVHIIWSMWNGFIEIFSLQVRRR